MFCAVEKGRPDANASPDLNPFSLEFSAAATLSFIDFLPADKAVLIGYIQTLTVYIGLASAQWYFHVVA
jgi:hypothetical protein